IAILDVVGIAERHLRPASQTRTHRVTLRITLDDLGQIRYKFGPLRTRTHKTHIPAQYVKKLRKLIDAIFPQNNADAGYSRIVALGPLRPPIFFGVHAHGTEFQEIERYAAAAHTLLAIKDGTARIQANQNREEYRNGKRD